MTLARTARAVRRSLASKKPFKPLIAKADKVPILKVPRTSTMRSRARPFFLGKCLIILVGYGLWSETDGGIAGKIGFTVDRFSSAKES